MLSSAFVGEFHNVIYFRWKCMCRVSAVNCHCLSKLTFVFAIRQFIHAIDIEFDFHFEPGQICAVSIETQTNNCQMPSCFPPELLLLCLRVHFAIAKNKPKTQSAEWIYCTIRTAFRLPARSINRRIYLHRMRLLFKCRVQFSRASQFIVAISTLLFIDSKQLILN